MLADIWPPVPLHRFAVESSITAFIMPSVDKCYVQHYDFGADITPGAT